MKKLLIITAAMFATVSLYAQGTVGFANNTATVIRDITTGAGATAGTAFRVQLYYAPDTGSVPNVADFSTLGASTTIGPFIAGTFNGGNRTTPTTTAGGGTAYFMVKGWEAAFGSTYEIASQVNGAKVGTSAIMRIATGNPGGSPPTNPTSLVAGTPSVSPAFTGFTLTPVPEPSVIGLSLLGAGALLLLRRRK